MGYEIDTTDGLHRLRTAREAFLSERRLPEDFPEWLGSAWRRARFLGLDVSLERVPSGQVDDGSALVRTAAPVLQQVATSLSGLHAAVVLSDERARIVGAWASDTLSRGHLDGIGSQAGADLSERSTGANGISHVLLTRRPAVIGGPEHLLELYQETVCAGAPVHGPRSSTPVGAIAVVGRLDAPSPVLQALAATAAASVERELLHAATGQERRLLEAFLTAGRDGAPVAVLDGRTRLVSDAAAALLEHADLELLEAQAHAAAREGRVSETRLSLDRVEVTMSPATTADNPGIVATLHPRTAPAQRRHRRTAPSLFASAGLAGESPLWRSLERSLSRAAGRPLLLTGEPGVGKTAIARAALRGATVLDAVDEPEFVSGLGEALAGTPLEGATEGATGAGTTGETAHGAGRPVVVRRLDRLTGLRATRAWELLAGARTPIAATWTRGEEVAPELRRVWAPYELPVPALRARTEDLPDIAAALVPGTRLSLAARTLLARYDWPGNVTELHAVVRCAAAAAAGAPIAPDHLPPALRAAASRPHLSELERAERSAIVEALRSTDGNRSRAAALLGIGRATLYRKLRHYRLD